MKAKVVFIGSLRHCRTSMAMAKGLFESLGMEVFSPDDEGLQNKPLLDIQELWFNLITDCSFVVAFAKYRELDLEAPGQTIMRYEYGESTSYELAIALNSNKKVFAWVD